MKKAKIIGIILALILLPACLSSPFTNRQSATAKVEISTPSKVSPSETPVASATPETNPCIFLPEKDSLLLQSVYQTDLAKFGIRMKNISEPVLSPDKQYLALSLYEIKGDKRLSHLAVLNTKESTTAWLFEYPSVDWSSVAVAWSPDSQWVAFLPGNVAFGEDGGLWVFEINGQRKYRHKPAGEIVGWNEDSNRVYFQYKDALGFVDLQDWEVTLSERCP